MHHFEFSQPLRISKYPLETLIRIFKQITRLIHPPKQHYLGKSQLYVTQRYINSSSS